MIDRFLKRKEVETATTLSKASIYRRMGEGTFPKPVPVGLRAVAWLESDVAAWQQQQRDKAIAA